MKKNNYLLTIILFILPLIIISINTKALNDYVYTLITEGKYILNTGFFTSEVLTLNTSLNTISYSWLSSILFYFIFKTFNGFGLFIFALLCNILICFITYKICILISNNKMVSILTTYLMNLLITKFIEISPLLLSFIIILLIIYILELYINKKNKNILILIPLLSCLQINIYCTYWLFIFVILFFYIIDSFNIKFLHTQNYKTIPLILIFIISLIVGLINPYGISAITHVFDFDFAVYSSNYINGYDQFIFSNNYCKFMYGVMIATGIIYAIYKSNNVRLRYICLTVISFLISFASIKFFSLVALLAIFPFAFLFRDMKINLNLDKFKKLFIVIIVLMVILFGYLLINKTNESLTYNPISKVIDIIDKENKTENKEIYVPYNYGGYLEYRGYKPFIDTRVEIAFNKKYMNKQIYIPEEAIERVSFDYESFLNNFKFNYIILDNDSVLLEYTNSKTDYFILYKDDNFKLFAKKSLYEKEEIKYYKEKYSK